MFVSISVAAAAETDVDAADGAEFCDAAVAGRTGVTLAGTAGGATFGPWAGPALLATVEDAIRLFVGGTGVGPPVVACGGQEVVVVVLLLALELPLMLLLLPEEGGAGFGDGSEHDSGEDSDDDEDEDDILLLGLLSAAAEAAAAIW